MSIVIKVLNKLPVFGRGKTCLVCNQRFNAWLPLPSFYASNLQQHGFDFALEDFETLNVAGFLCPSCSCSDRDRLMALYLKSQVLQLGRPLRILDIAPAASLRRWLKQQPDVDYLSCDLYMQDVDVQADIQRMDCFEDNRFDVVICSHVLEHVPDDKQALRELFRILKPGGQALLLVPILSDDKLAMVREDPQINDTAERWRLFGQDDHIRLYNQSGFTNRIASAGFTVQQFVPDGNQENLSRLGIAEGSVLYIGKK